MEPGTLYVYRGEDNDPIAVARSRVGPRGGFTADSLATFSVPSKHVSGEDLEKYARLFAAAPDLLKALKHIAKHWPEDFPGMHARAAIAKAEGK